MVAGKLHRVLQWPACSPDINPVENLWDILVHRVYARNRQFQTVDALRVAILEGWYGIQEDILVLLIGSMSNRVFELITSKGGSIHY